MAVSSCTSCNISLVRPKDILMLVIVKTSGFFLRNLFHSHKV